MHRLKGLEYSCVLIAGTEAGQLPTPPREGSPTDDESLKTHELRESPILCGGHPRP